MRLALLAAAAVVGASVLAFAYVWRDARAFRAAVELPSRHPCESQPMHIAVIGDSWAAPAAFDLRLETALAARGVIAKVAVYAHPGATTRQIYDDLLANRDVLFGAPAPRACIVIAGVNDASRYVGADFYVHHLRLIVDCLRRRGIEPIVLELPRSNIENAESTNPVGWVRRRLMRWAYNDGVVNVIPAYREAARKALSDVRIVPFAEEYSPQSDAYQPDGSHLNERGTDRLIATLADAVKSQLSKEH